MTDDRGGGWWRPDAVLPAFAIVGPYFLNKLVYICFPGLLIFETTDYACRILSLALLYLLLRPKPASPPIALPIPWRLAIPSAREFLLVLSGAVALIVSNVVGLTLSAL